MVAKTKNPKVGDVFSRLTVTGEPVLRGHNLYIPVRCTCGKEKLIAKPSLVKGVSTSCGCYNSEVASKRFRKHPKGSDKTYNIWHQMVGRCTRPNHASWDNYGGRGITVCDRWLVFQNFWEDMGEAPKGLSIERIDNNLGYSKSNCEWVSRQRNQLNKRNTVFVEYQGKKVTLCYLSDVTGVSWQNLYQRLFVKKLSMEEAVKPVKFKSKNGQAVWNKPK